MADVSVVGVGAMGAPIARNLLAAGFEVAVWNRDRSRLASLVEVGAVELGDVAEAFEAGVVLSVLGDDAAVKDVFLDDGALGGVGAGVVHVNLATISPDLAREAAAAHAAAGVGYVAAPMFGGVPVAEAAKLNIVVGGEGAAIERVRPLLEAISAGIWPVGTVPEQANVVKVAGNLLIASAIQSLSEAVSLAERSGIDATWLVELFTSTITPGPVYSNYGNLIATSRYEPAGFTSLLGRKDIDLARAQAAHTGLRLPAADLLSGLLTEAVDAGRGTQDWAALAAMQRHRDGTVTP